MSITGSMASLGISSPDSWPRMPSDVENPFQNAPGPFIYALPNLAAPGPSLFSLNYPGLAPLSNHYDNHRHHHLPYHNPAATPYSSPVESACPLPENPDLELSHVQFPPITFEFDENDDEDTGPSQQQQEHQSSSGSSTPTPSQGSSSTAASESSEEKEEEEEGSEHSPKERGKRRRRTGKGARRRRRNRHSSEQAGCVMGPRVMGMPGFHPQRWFQPSHLPPQPSPALSLPLHGA